MPPIVRRITGWLAIAVVALHVLMTGLTPVMGASGDLPFDPLAVTCLHEQQADENGPAQPGTVAGHVCDHCVLCVAVPAGIPPAIPFALLRPLALAWTAARLQHPVAPSITSRPGIPRAPPSA
jgi:hypothetical protein